MWHNVCKYNVRAHGATVKVLTIMGNFRMVHIVLYVCMCLLYVKIKYKINIKFGTFEFLRH